MEALMQRHPRLINNLQIIGFSISTAVTLVLVIANADPLISVLIGLVLAVLTQLFDLQIRHSASEERLLKATTLSQSLYHSDQLLADIRHIVEDYDGVQKVWFAGFKLRAEEALQECHNTLHTLAEGHMDVSTHLSFSLALTGLGYASKSWKELLEWEALSSSGAGLRQWLTQSQQKASQRGIQVQRIVSVSREMAPKMGAEMIPLQQHTASYLVIVRDEAPVDLDENYLIMDDRAAAHLERTAGGGLRETQVTIDTTEVERLVKHFAMVLVYARPLADFVAAHSGAIKEG
jgi:hypothetical protein